ncbi:hypothetical protein AAKU64_000328 [Undibacterium sp. GrIS 1.8]
MNERKSWKLLVKETFTKSRGESYAESTKNEKIWY